MRQCIYINTLLKFLLGASEVSANLHCNLRTSVLGRLRDYLRLLMKRSVPVFCLFVNLSSYLPVSLSIYLDTTKTPDSESAPSEQDIYDY